MSTMPTYAEQEQNSRNLHSAFWPLLLALLAFLSWTVFQTTQLISERSSLTQAHAEQAAPLEQSQQLRAATDSLVAKTQKLADAGDASAQFVMLQLKQRGYPSNPGATTQAPPQ